MKLYITKFWTEEQNFCFCIFNMILCKSQEVRINLKMYFLLNIVSTLKSENICFNSTRQKCTEFNSYQEKWSRLKFQDSKKFVVRFRFYWRPPEGFYFHWRGFKKCLLQLKTLRRVIYIPLEGFRCPSWGVIIPLEGLSYPS